MDDGFIITIVWYDSQILYGKHNVKEFIRDKTRKLLIPSPLDFCFQWILGYYNIEISGAGKFESVQE